MKTQHGFVRRVAWVGLSSAAIGALVAASVAIVTVDWLLRSQADRRLRGAVIELAGELDEDPPERRRERLEQELYDENREIEPSGISLAVFAGKRRLAGEGAERTPNVGNCETQKRLGTRVRSCSIRYGEWTLVATAVSDASLLGWLYLVAALGACLTGAAAGGLLARRRAKWAIEPLEAMTEQLATIVPGRDVRLGTASDCQELEAVRAAIEALLVRIRTLLAQAERFAADAAHELRSPMAALSVELELLAETLPDTEQQSVLLAHERVIKLSALIERLLISALPTENLRAGFVPVALEEIVLESIRNGTEMLKSRVKFTPGVEGLILGDPQLLTSLVQNALDNAIKHGAGTVSVTLVETCEQVCLEINDRGPGIDGALRERVFEPFFRATEGQTEGHGLGLSLIGQVAHAHGGEARFVDSEHGATLVVTLPAWSSRGSEDERS